MELQLMVKVNAKNNTYLTASTEYQRNFVGKTDNFKLLVFPVLVKNISHLQSIKQRKVSKSNIWEALINKWKSQIN